MDRYPRGLDFPFVLLFDLETRGSAIILSSLREIKELVRRSLTPMVRMHEYNQVSCSHLAPGSRSRVLEHVGECLPETGEIFSRDTRLLAEKRAIEPMLPI